LKRQRQLATEKAREDRKAAEEAKRLWEIEKREIERKTMVEKAKQDKLNQQRLKEEREKLMHLNALLSPRSQRPLPSLKNYYVCACGFQNEESLKFCENCGDTQPVAKVEPPTIQTSNHSILSSPQVLCTMFCGFKNDLGRKFCESCGAKVDPPIHCHCGHPNEPTRKFCEACGSKLGAGGNSEQAEVQVDHICASCGHNNEGSRKFCEECGSKIIQQVKCAECSHMNDSDRLFCGGCGSKLQQQIESKPQEPKPQEKPRNPICSFCGEKNDPERMFCSECGTKL